MDQPLVLVVLVEVARVQLDHRLAAQQAQQTRVAGAATLSIPMPRSDQVEQVAAVSLLYE